VFSKLYQMAEKQDTSIPVLINKLIEKSLAKRKIMNKTEQSLKVKIVNAICGSGKVTNSNNI
jgi:transketolase